MIKMQAATVKPQEDEWAVAIWPMDQNDNYITHAGKGVVTLMTPNEARLFASLLVKYAETAEECNGEPVSELQAMFRLIRGEG